MLAISMTRSHMFLLIVLALQLVLTPNTSAMSLQKPLLTYLSSSSQVSVFNQPVSCGEDSDVFKLESIQLIPDSPVRGQPLRLVAKGTLDEDVVDGSVARVKVKLGVIQLLDQEFNLCEQVKNIDKECPLKKGPFELDKSFDIPSQIPRGKYHVHVLATNADSRQIGCFDIEFRISQ